MPLRQLYGSNNARNLIVPVLGKYKTLKEKMLAEMLEEMVSIIEADSQPNTLFLQENCKKHPYEICIDEATGFEKYKKAKNFNSNFKRL